jgi:hypothetical protein
MSRHLLLPSLLLAALALTLSAAENASPSIPAQWQAAWREPSAHDRPRLIVHGIRPQKMGQPETPDEKDIFTEIVPAARPKWLTPDGMRYFTGLGLGGIVCNVDFRHYMQSRGYWNTLVAGVEACRQIGAVVWFYDEDGYPSGAAGGQVLAENRALEATSLCYDPSRPEPFFLRPAYEHTHASNNFYRARRYINLLDDRAVASFIRHTHEAYWQRLKQDFGHTIEAFFTDEPSLIAVNMGRLGDEVRTKVPVIDAVDSSVVPLPTIPWAYDLAARYQARYHEDLLPERRSLFTGDGADDRRIRRQFWALVADLVADRYYGQIQRWCAAHHVASSGHTLAEESLIHHVPLDGNKIKVLGRMDIPGLDLLSSNPEVVAYGGWITAAMPASAAALHGRRRIMTEVSDISEALAKLPPARLDAMRATAAWQAAWGVTDFNLYYKPQDRSVEQFQAYGQFVGRLNAVLKPAQVDSDVLLYYPIYDLWAEYRPVAERLDIKTQSPLAQRIVGGFLRLGTMLQNGQIPFILIDHEMLAAARIDAKAGLNVGGHRFTALVLPEGIELPASVADVVKKFRQSGGRVLADAEATRLTATTVRDAIKPTYCLSPTSEKIAFGRFMRDGRPVLLLVNVGQTLYNGELSVGPDKAWIRMDPQTGEIASLEASSNGRIPLSVASRQTLLVIGSR